MIIWLQSDQAERSFIHIFYGYIDEATVQLYITTKLESQEGQVKSPEDMENDFPNLVVSKLFCQGISGLLKEVVETSFMVSNKRFHLLSLLLPLITVASHVVQLLEPCLHTMLRAVPLAAYPLHYRQTGKGKTAVSVETNTRK